MNNVIRLLQTITYFSLIIFPTVSGEVPEQPVVSPISGAVYERRLLEKYLAENGTDPISNKELSIEQIIELKGNIENF